MARKFVELFFGRMDARTASYEATAELMSRYFPAGYELLRPGVTSENRRGARAGAPVRIAFSDREGRGALRLVPARAAPAPRGAAVGGRDLLEDRRGARRCAPACATACTCVDDEDEALTSADVVVAASLGQVTAPGVLVKALGAGAVPLAARVPVYEEVLREGDLGLHFQLGDVGVLAEQLERIVRDDELRAEFAAKGVRGARGARPGHAWPTRSRRSTSASPRCATTPTPSRRSARGSPSAS